MGQLTSVIYSSFNYEQMSREGNESRDSKNKMLASHDINYYAPRERTEKAQPTMSRGDVEGHPSVPA